MDTPKTADVIANALIALTEHHSYDAITIDRIAEKAAVHRNTVYYYFPDKDAIFEYIFAKDKERHLSYAEGASKDVFSNDFFYVMYNLLMERESFYSRIAKSSPDLLRSVLFDFFEVAFNRLFDYYINSRKMPDEFRVSIICFHAMGTTESIIKALRLGMMPKEHLIDSRILTTDSLKNAIDSYFSFREQ